MIFHLVAALAMAGLTWTLGWWGVVVAAAILGWVYRTERGRAWRVALAAAEGWALLLILDLLSGPLGTLATTLQGVMKIPSPALLLVTLLFPALLGWSAASAVSELALLVRPTDRS
ncbi:MAG: hypothetical protein ABIY52_01060 [Gemmatimonadaceae bacterium]